MRKLLGFIFVGLLVMTGVMSCSEPTSTPTMAEHVDCYHCVRPGHFGFGVYPHEIDRTTCNKKTKEYLETMQYKCFK